MHRRIPLTCHCEEAQPTWQSRSTRPDRRKAIGESATASPRFPRRFAPRNDKPGSIARSAKPLYNLPACKALTTRKGHAASVRRQSRQRLRSERRYRRNWSVHFIDALYELQVPSRDCTPRALPRASRSGRHVGLRPPRNDKSGPQCHFNDSLYWLQVRCRERHAAPLQLSARSVALIIHCRSIFFYCCGSFFPT